VFLLEELKPQAQPVLEMQSGQLSGLAPAEFRSPKNSKGNADGVVKVWKSEKLEPLEPRLSELSGLHNLFRRSGHKAKMLPAVGLTTFRGSYVVTKTKLELLHDQILCHPLELCKLNPSLVFQLTVAKEFLVGFTHDYDLVFLGNKRAVDEVFRGGGVKADSGRCRVAGRMPLGKGHWNEKQRGVLEFAGQSAGDGEREFAFPKTTHLKGSG
jgi:hypothetical protein